MNLLKRMWSGGIFGVMIAAALVGICEYWSYKNKNYTNVGLKKISTFSKISEEAIGENNLEIAVNEMCQLTYVCKDQDKLKEIIFYDNGKEITKISIDGSLTQICSALFVVPRKSKDHVYRVVAVDMHGNKREDSAKLFVTDKDFKREELVPQKESGLY